MSIFSSRLKELRLAKGLTLKQVSEALSIPLQTYANYEHGIRQPPIELIVTMCRLFDTSADYLIGLTDY